MRGSACRTSATAFEPFPSDTSYFGRTTQGWMINFRVRNLDTMVAQLQASGVEVTIDPEKYPNGRFARLRDPEGNPVELWEPQEGDGWTHEADMAVRPSSVGGFSRPTRPLAVG